MTIDIKVPVLGESVTEATVGKWLKNAGDAVKLDEPLVELEMIRFPSRCRRQLQVYWARSSCPLA